MTGRGVRERELKQYHSELDLARHHYPKADIWKMLLRDRR